MGGFDIVSPAEGANVAWANLQMGGADTAGLYSIGLETGTALRLSGLGTGGVSGFGAGTGVGTDGMSLHPRPARRARRDGIGPSSYRTTGTFAPPGGGRARPCAAPLPKPPQAWRMRCT